MAQEAAPLSVTQAVAAAKDAVNALPNLVVTGEVSGFRGPNARSGHCYFQIKDDTSAMDVIIWRSTYARAGVRLKDGLQIQLTGGFDVYVGTGRLSFIAKSVSVAGEGLLRQQVAALARKLEREGLMAAERKRPVPRFCTRVAVVTSLSGSVIEDVKRTLKRRNPLVAIDAVGCAVQGAHAPQTIIRALEVAAAARPEAILLVRGGGSFEDLMTFNDEALARAVAACLVPVVTGIGHEPDTSICDMVADKRCSTPTAAAEAVAPALGEIVQAIQDRQRRLSFALASKLEREAQGVSLLQDRGARAMTARLSQEQLLLDGLSKHQCLQDPFYMIGARRDQLLQTEQRLSDALPRSLQYQKEQIRHQQERLDRVSKQLLSPYEQLSVRLAASLEALSPLKVLGRGYAIAQTKEGEVLQDATKVVVGENITVRLQKGSLEARVCGTSLESHNQ